MQIVIDIDEEDYKDINNIHFIREDLKFKIGKAIMNGTPLPKEHGRLIDTDVVQSMARKKAEDCFPEGRYYYGYRKSLFEFAEEIDDVPTIIEADKEGEDE